jgi:hypothetical protein
MFIITRVKGMFIITRVKGVFDLQFDKRKKQKCVLNEKQNAKRQQQSKEILKWDTLYNITFDRMVTIFFIEFVIFALFAMLLDYCNI